MDAKHAIYAVIAVIGGFLLAFKFGGPAWSDAAVIDHAQGQTVRWSAFARHGFLAAGITFCLAGVALGTRENKRWGAIATFGLFGLAVIAASALLMWPSRIDLYADRIEIRDRPMYLSAPLVIAYADIDTLTTDRQGQATIYIFSLAGGEVIELGHNPILNTAWPLLRERIDTPPDSASF